MHHEDWKINYDKIKEFRRSLKDKYGFPVKVEIHCKQFLMNKNPYHGKFSDDTRRKIFDDFIDFVPRMKIRSINVVIDKMNISYSDYKVLDNAFKYSIQRIENDLEKDHKSKYFMIFCDKGRIGKMRKTARKIQVYNNIPSKIHEGHSYRNEIKGLIEDPIEKDSKESYFIQISDAMAFVVYLYALRNLMKWQEPWAGRILKMINYGEELNYLDILLPILNTKASHKNKYGIVYYPK